MSGNDKIDIKTIELDNIDFLEIVACVVDYASFKNIIGQGKEADKLHRLHMRLSEKWEKGRVIGWGRYKYLKTEKES